MLYKKKFLFKIISEKKKEKNKNFFLSYKKINNNSYKNIKNTKIQQKNVRISPTTIVTPFNDLNQNKIANEIFLIKYNNLLILPNQIKKINSQQLIQRTNFLLTLTPKFYYLLQTLAKNLKNC